MSDRKPGEGSCDQQAIFAVKMWDSHGQLVEWEEIQLLSVILIYWAVYVDVFSVGI